MGSATLRPFGRMWMLVVILGLVLLVLQVWWWRRDSETRRALADKEELVAQLERAREMAEEEGKARLQTLFNSMVEGVMLLDRAGRIQLVNQSLERQFNLFVDIRGLTVMESIRLPELTRLIEQLPNSRGVLTTEIELSGVEPSHLEVNAASVLDRRGVPQGAILVFHDLTRIRQLEHTRREFVANVSHELRTPLSLIKGYVETLLGGAKDDPEVATRFLLTIERHSNRLNNLIEDLLTISRLESGQITLKFQNTALQGFVAALLEELQTRAAEKKMTFHNGIPPDLTARVDVDRLQQVLFNLLDNAIKYGRSHGKITIQGRRLPTRRVELCVSDDGPGIPIEARTRIFERFYRVDRARSRETGGTGLGLSIVKHIVQSHGGEVWVESEPGKGASFFFTLPEPEETDGLMADG